MTQFSAADIEQINARGLSAGQVERQIELLRKADSFLKIDRPATVNDGIVSLSQENLKPYLDFHNQAERDGRLIKFIPASGAATRMFADLIAFHHEPSSANAERIKPILDSIASLPFYDDLKMLCFRLHKDLDEMVRSGNYGGFLGLLLYEQGLNYANLPKALMKFHRYKDRSRTALEEQFIEAKAYLEDRHGIVRLHMTVSPEHKEAAEKHLAHVKRNLAEELTTQFDVFISVQKSSTDTVALDGENNLFRDGDGKLLFRPGGHGALLENLNDLKGDIVFIKNIDNTCCDRYKHDTILYKKMLCGYLITLEKEIFGYLEALKQGKADGAFLSKSAAFLKEKLSVTMPAEFSKKTAGEKSCMLFAKLNRPLRVCGMVKNEGEPGGAPFWITDADGGVSLQIIESSEVNPEVPDQQAKFRASTHFNPVDFVCAVRDFQGNPFDLTKYRNSEAVFVSEKLRNGKKIKQLELPGLWNGAMARWNTVCVEVPISTFTPVKTVRDFLRKPHQCA